MFAINALGFFDDSSDSNAFENSSTLLPSQDIVSIPKDLNFFSMFIIDFSNEMPFFYGLFTIMFAVILGVGAAFIRKFISNFRKKLLVKS